MPTIADDSGIFITVFADELGLKTRRWGAGEHASDSEWLDVFMNRMKDEKIDLRNLFVRQLLLMVKKVLFMSEHTEGLISGRVEVEIKVGLPLSSVFKPVPMIKYSALSDEEKNKISHRGKAFKNC